jgi:undecaprenyl-diphosphatase
MAWVIGGVAIIATDRWRAETHDGETRKGIDLTDLTWRLALIIGFAQCIAMWPGVSRSLVTIVAGVLVGLRLAAAVEFSFLLGVVTLGAATCYDGLKHGPVMLKHYGAEDMILGFLFAFISAVIAIKWMVSYLKRHGMAVFGYYRIAIGVLVGVMLLMGVIGGHAGPAITAPATP